jgi:integrase
VRRNVATLVDRPRSRRVEVQPLTPQQARTLLAAARGERLEALYLVALAVGLRQGEALGRRWEDIDLDAGVLKVRVALQRVKGKLQLVEPKTTKSRRTIALPQAVVGALRAHRTRQLEERLREGARWQEMGLVFPSTIGNPA